MLQKAIPDISKQMLVNQLRELEDDNILQRIVFAEIPPRVEYCLTDLGFSLLPVIDVMEQWGASQMELSCES
jgi:DNA-binding HxlR family transcriptional regulator